MPRWGLLCQSRLSVAIAKNFYNQSIREIINICASRNLQIVRTQVHTSSPGSIVSCGSQGHKDEILTYRQGHDLCDKSNLLCDVKHPVDGGSV